MLLFYALVPKEPPTSLREAEAKEQEVPKETLGNLSVSKKQRAFTLCYAERNQEVTPLVRNASFILIRV